MVVAMFKTRIITNLEWHVNPKLNFHFNLVVINIINMFLGIYVGVIGSDFLFFKRKSI